MVCAPGQRYHPAVAVIAQAAATLAEMFPGRFRLALGSDEAPNEHVTGGLWPEPHVAWLRHDVELGFSGIYLNPVGGNLPYFIETFGEWVLPAVARS